MNRSIRFKKSATWQWILLLMSAFPGLAAAVPVSYSGALSYGYGFVKSDDAEAESTSLTFNLNVTGFIWRPWFITYNAGGSIGGAKAESTNSDTATSAALAGNLGLNVFPSSRFPFSLLLSRSDSSVENRSALSTLGTTNYTTSRILMMQTYKGRDNFLTNFSWAYSEFESDISSSTSNALNYDARYRQTKYAWMAGASYNETSNSESTVRPRNFTARANHNYVPGNQLGVTTSLSYNQSDVKLPSGSTQTRVAQVSSIYSWRPEHKPYSFSGGARVSTSDSSQVGEANAMSLSLGVNYRLTRKVSVSANGSVSAAEAGGVNTNSGSANVSTGYNSDQFSIMGFRYNWRTSGGYSYNTSRSDSATTADKESESSTMSFSLGHTAARNWALGRTSALSLSVSQSGGMGYSDSGVGNGTIGHSAGLNLSSNDRKGSTFLGSSFTDTRSCSDCEAEFNSAAQYVAFQLARNQGINRLSSLTANASYQWGKQKKLQQNQANQEVTVKSYTRSTNMNANYHHLRAFGVYALNYTSALSFSRNFNVEGDARDTLTWENHFTYVIGLLDTSLSIDGIKQGEDVRWAMSFRATRSF